MWGWSETEPGSQIHHWGLFFPISREVEQKLAEAPGRSRCRKRGQGRSPEWRDLSTGSAAQMDNGVISRGENQLEEQEKGRKTAIPRPAERTDFRGHRGRRREESREHRRVYTSPAGKNSQPVGIRCVCRNHSAWAHWQLEGGVAGRCKGPGHTCLWLVRVDLRNIQHNIVKQIILQSKLNKVKNKVGHSRLVVCSGSVTALGGTGGFLRPVVTGTTHSQVRETWRLGQSSAHFSATVGQQDRLACRFGRSNPGRVGMSLWFARQCINLIIQCRTYLVSFFYWSSACLVWYVSARKYSSQDIFSQDYTEKLSIF